MYEKSEDKKIWIHLKQSWWIFFLLNKENRFWLKEMQKCLVRPSIKIRYKLKGIVLKEDSDWKSL